MISRFIVAPFEQIDRGCTLAQRYATMFRYRSKRERQENAGFRGADAPSPRHSGLTKREPGIQVSSEPAVRWIAGSRQVTRPGMTEKKIKLSSHPRGDSANRGDAADIHASGGQLLRQEHSKAPLPLDSVGHHRTFP